MLLEVQHVRKEFQNRTHALTDASFSVSQGDFVSVIGPSGAGKTTLFRILNGSLRCDGGAILVNGIHFESADRRTRRAIQTTIGTIYQDFALVENATCRQNVLNACLPDMAFLPAVCGFFGKERVAEADALLERVGLADKVHEPVKNLSGGQKQRVAIARALMRHPALLLADEPVASLDPVTGRQILELLRDIQQDQKLTVLMNSHNLELSQEFSSRLIGLNQGAVVLDALFLLLLAAARFTDCSPALFWARRSHLTDLISAMLPPDWGYAPRILAPLLATVQMSVTGTALGSFLALLLAPLCAENLHAPKPLRWTLRLLVQVLRSFPTLILALLATFLFGLGTFSGTVAITVYTFAILTRLTYEDIESAELAPYHALCAMGAVPSKVYWRAVVPGIAPSYFSNVLYLLETNVRHSSILGYVGAGGIGLLLNEKISWLEYGKVGMILFFLFLTVCVIEGISSLLSQIIREERSLSPLGKRLLTGAAVLLVLVCTLSLQPPDFSHISPRAVQAMISGLFHPDWAFFFETDTSGLGYLLLETVCIALVGTCAGTVIAVPLSFLSTPCLMPQLPALLFRVVIMAIRSVPFLIYGLIFIRVAGPGPFTGVLTLGICSVGLLSKRFTEAIESLDFRAYHALESMGVPLLLRIRYAVLPQLLPALASAVLYRFDVNIREASVLGLVGAGGIGAPLIFAMNHYKWSEAGAIALGLILLVWCIDRLSASLRR